MDAINSKPPITNFCPVVFLGLNYNSDDAKQNFRFFSAVWTVGNRSGNFKLKPLPGWESEK